MKQTALSTGIKTMRSAKTLILFCFVVNFFLHAESIKCPGHGKPRVRREWRTLSSSQRSRVVRAMWIMRLMPTEVGQLHYGPNYKGWEDFVVQHACAVLDPRCDQGHYGPIFGIFHRAFLLQFENSLLSIDPIIGALPYWNMALDSSTGKYRHDSQNYIFSDNFFGSFRGDVRDNFAVTNGKFAKWPIDIFNESRHGSKSNSNYQCLQEGWMVPQPATTCRRCCGKTPEECQCNESHDVYDTFLRTTGECTPFTVRDYSKFPGMIGNTRELLYDENNFHACTNARNIRSFEQWQNCIDLGRSTCFFPPGIDISQFPTPDNASLMRKTNALAYLATENQTCEMLGHFYQRRSRRRSRRRVRVRRSRKIEVNALHSQVHFKLWGDMGDVATSPNDPIFFSHHADMDRSAMTWMANSEHLESDFWHFPRDSSDSSGRPRAGFSGPTSIYGLKYCGARFKERYPAFEPYAHAWTPGTTLHDTMNRGYPFMQLFNEKNNAHPYTPKDIIMHTTISQTPYTYDTLEHLYEGC